MYPPKLLKFLISKSLYEISQVKKVMVNKSMTQFLSKIFIVNLLIFSTSLVAGPREQAFDIHNRVAGSPPSAVVLDQMANLITNNNAVAAVELAMNNPGFCNVVLKSWVKPLTNEDMSVQVPLNDMSATMIGMIRDDVPFDQVLYSDILYTGVITPDYSLANNDHYIAMENQKVDLCDDSQLVRTTQSSTPGNPLNANDVAGILTTRGFAEAFLIAGTNRAATRFTLLNFLGRDMEQLTDTSRVPDRVRQDVTRVPGGDSSLYLTNCVGCHAGMDPLTQAFAYYNFDEQTGALDFTDNQVQPKNLINSGNFRFGYVTTNDRWDNYWCDGPNAILGWRGNCGGSGPKSMGTHLSASRAFAEYQVEKVFNLVCLRSPENSADRTALQDIANNFEIGSAYNMKQVIAETAVYCTQ